MRKIWILISILLLTSIGYGQSAMTVRELKQLNAKADWVKVNENAKTGEPIYIDSNFIDRDEMLVYFRVKITRELSGDTYAVVASGCISGTYIFNNIFFETPTGQLVSAGNKASEPYEAKRGDMMYSAIHYACNYKPTKKGLTLAT